MKPILVLYLFLAILVDCQQARAAAPGRPNILFAISDDQSWMHCGAYGDKGTRTPSFDRIARQGVLFRHAYAAAPSCGPSRSAILTGRNTWELEKAGNLMGILDSKFTLFTLKLQEAGYELGATGKTWGPGKLSGYRTKDGKPDLGRKYRASGTQQIIGKAWDSIRLESAPRGISRTDYAANFDAFLAGRDTSRPFFFWYGATEPHQNYEIGGWKKAGKKLSDALVPGCLPDTPEVRGEFLDYGLEIEHFDRHLGRMINALEKTGLLENTLIVVTSDHGNPMPRSKCNLYDSGIRVPLAVRWPGKVPAGRTLDDFVNLADLAPTFLETAGVKVPEVMTARSFLDILRSEKEGLVDPSRDFVVTAFERHVITRRGGVGYPMRSIRTHRYAYIRNYEPGRWPAGDPDYYSSNRTFFGDVDSGVTKFFILDNFMSARVHPYYLLSFGRRPAEELYDMNSDPHQLKNLAGEEALAGVKGKLTARLDAYLESTGDPRHRGEAPWDSYPFIDGEIFKNKAWQEKGRARTLTPPK